VKLLRNLNRAIESEVRLEGLAQARLAESRQERAAMMTLDNKNDEENDSTSRGDQSVLNDQEVEDGVPLVSSESMDAR
jgi:hypothetical protein